MRPSQKVMTSPMGNSDHASVQLPAEIETGDLLALGDQLHARLHEVTKPRRKGEAPPAGCPVGASVSAPVEASWKRLSAGLAALREVTAKRDHPDAAEPALDPDASNASSDEAWRAFDAWLGGWAKHRDDGKKPGAAEARALQARLFPKPGGMQFIGWRPRKQWTAMTSRMAILAEPGVAALVKALGGERMSDALEVTHADFGKAYGFTAAQSDEAEGVDTRPQILTVKDALRAYVKKVEGSADPDVAGSEALASWLLGPFDALVAEFSARPSAARAKPAAPPTK